MRKYNERRQSYQSLCDRKETITSNDDDRGVLLESEFEEEETQGEK